MKTDLAAIQSKIDDCIDEINSELVLIEKVGVLDVCITDDPEEVYLNSVFESALYDRKRFYERKRKELERKRNLFSTEGCIKYGSR